tara:strand:- start:1018 stop:1236 length:219 start_codon:yes stop_codon:yes gene_type:complete
MKKIKKIKIRVNGKVMLIKENTDLLKLADNLKIPLKKVAIELNKEIMNKKKMNGKILKKNDTVEIVHFIGGG